MSKMKIFTDGGSRNNPGPAGIGGVGFDEHDQELFRFKKFLGTKTNNQAEYLALLEGMVLAKSHGANQLECYLDSELVVKQLNGLYKIKHPDIQPLAAEVLKTKNDFAKISFTHVLRDKNKIADSLVNEAIDEATKNTP